MVKDSEQQVVNIVYMYSKIQIQSCAYVRKLKYK